MVVLVLVWVKGSCLGFLHKFLGLIGVAFTLVGSFGNLLLAILAKSLVLVLVVTLLSFS